MSGSVNKVILIGNLGSDPEVRSTPTGQQVATLSIATSRNYKDREGNRREETEWHRVIVWNQLAELAQRYLAKGRKVYIEGRLQTRSWDDAQTGQKRYATEIVADQMTFLDSGKDGQCERSESRPATGAPSGAPATQRAPESRQPVQGDLGDDGFYDADSLPF